MTLRGEQQLERYHTVSLENQKHVTIYCNSGALWVTAGQGFGDIVLSKGQSISLITKEKVVIEALETASVKIAHTKQESIPELALQN